MIFQINFLLFGDKCYEKRFTITYTGGVIRLYRRSIQKFTNGRHSITALKNWVMAETGKELALEKLVRYLNFLKEIGWIEF